MKEQNGRREGGRERETENEGERESVCVLSIRIKEHTSGILKFSTKRCKNFLASFDPSLISCIMFRVGGLGFKFSHEEVMQFIW